VLDVRHLLVSAGTLAGHDFRMTEVAVVAEHALFAEALAIRIEAEDDLSVVGTATDGGAATDLAARHPVDVILLDIDLHDEDGIALARHLREIRPEARVIVLSELCDPSRAAWALHYGARGWVLKGRPFDELLRVIRGALRDETRVPPQLLTKVLARLTPTTDMAPTTLTRRELEVFGYLVEGLNAADIAGRLRLAGGTVRAHVRNLLLKLGVQSAEQAVALGLARGIHPPAGTDRQPTD